MNDKTAVACTGILGLVCLEGIALLTHQDGAFFMPCVAAISGIVGAVLGQKISAVKKMLGG